ncbi:MAG: phosphatase PAP2 family protein [Flavobacterium sp.]|nr:MAG: phosphatase PAP2 family protein [Flavobacterium sp.]
MLKNILEIDKELFLFLNGLGSERWDSFWLLITKQVCWVPVFIVIAYLLFRHLGWKHALLLFILVTVQLTFTDQTTNIVKNYFHRLRPGSTPELAHLMRVVQSRNSFSFFSGHAANSMSVAFFLFLVMRRYVKYMGIIFIWPLIFAYSRIYLGLHYPLDILCGYIWGIFTATLIYQLYRFLRNRFFPQKENLDNPTNG